MSEDRDSFVSEEYLKNVWHVRPVLGLRAAVGIGWIAAGVEVAIAVIGGNAVVS
jgi:hypothetical protein